MKNILKTLAVIALLFTTTSVFAAADYYLKIEGIKGEAKGKTFKVNYDKNGKGQTPALPPGEYLMKMCATGTHIKQAKLFVRKQGTDQHDYMKEGEIQIESFSLGMSEPKPTAKGGVHVAVGDVDGDGMAEDKTSTGGGISSARTSGGGSGKASFSDLSFSVKTTDGKTASSQGGGSGSGKVVLQDFHITMKSSPSLGRDMFEGEIGTIKIIGPIDNAMSKGTANVFDTEMLTFSQPDTK